MKQKFCASSWLITEKNVFYLRARYLPLSKHRPSRLYKTIILMLYKAKVAICFAILKEQMNTLCGQNITFSNVKPGSTYSPRYALKGKFVKE